MARLYAQGERWQLYLGDALEVAQKFLQPNSVDFVITDPPYSWKYETVYAKLSQICMNYLKDGGIALLFMGSHSLDKKMKVMMEAGLVYLWCFKCTWRPMTGTPKIFYPVPVFVMSRLLVAYGKGDIKLVRERWNRKRAMPDLIELERTEREMKWATNDVVVGESLPNKEGHHWQQNFHLFRRIAEMFVCPEDVVLDPFNGAGTTGAAVLEQGAHYIGIDIEEGGLAYAAKWFGDVSRHPQRYVTPTLFEEV
jgi:DNA modification methylase